MINNDICRGIDLLSFNGQRCRCGGEFDKLTTMDDLF